MTLTPDHIGVDLWRAFRAYETAMFDRVAIVIPDLTGTMELVREILERNYWNRYLKPRITPEESRPILNQLFTHCALPEHCLRLRWRPGMLVIWDNYATQHYAINDYHGFRREMRRATFQGPGLDAWRG